MGAILGDIIIAEMQAMTARNSFVITSHPSQRTTAAATSIRKLSARMSVGVVKAIRQS